MAVHPSRTQALDRRREQRGPAEVWARRGFRWHPHQAWTVGCVRPPPIIEELSYGQPRINPVHDQSQRRLCRLRLVLSSVT